MPEFPPINNKIEIQIIYQNNYKLDTYVKKEIDSNPLLLQDLDVSVLPLFSKFKPEHIRVIPSIVDKLKSEFEKFENELSNGIRTSFEDVFDYMEQIQYPLNRAWSIVSHLNGVCNSDELRKERADVQPMVIETMMMFGQSQPLYQVIKNMENLSSTEQRVVDATLLDMKHSGIALGEHMEHFNKIQQSISKLSSKFW